MLVCLTTDVRSSLVAGIGFFLDSYDIFAINLIATFLGVVFWQGKESSYGYGGNGGQLPVPVSQALKGSTSAGIIIGQAVFGWLADKHGRRRMYGIELGIILLSTMNYALANPSPAMSSTGLFTFWRVVMVRDGPGNTKTQSSEDKRLTFSSSPLGSRHWRRLSPFFGHYI